MPKNSRQGNNPELGEKDCWNLYSLQVLTPTKFIKVVGKVLDGRYILVGPKATKQVNK